MIIKNELSNAIRPDHYKLSNGMEVYDVIRDSFGEEYTKGFYFGNVLKYVCRHKEKNGIEDLKKAKWYLDKCIELVEKK